MFGPDIKTLANQTIIVSDGRESEAYRWLLEQLTQWGGLLSHTSADDHDQAMALIQVMRHFSTVAYGQHLKSEGANLGQITELSSPIYRLELAMVGRLFAQDPGLYTEIIFSNPDNIHMMRRYSERFSELLDLVESGDKEQFMQTFSQISDWFGDYAAQFLAESAGMLEYKKHLK
jgi:chorismate mutase/prephenate dehydrogenase